MNFIMDQEDDESLQYINNANFNGKRPRTPDDTQDRHPKITKNKSPHKNDNINGLIEQDFFKDNNYGPYGVWIKKINQDSTDLNAYKVGSILFKNYKQIQDIRIRGKFKVEVLFKNRTEANKILRDSVLNQHNLQPFIPGFRKVRKGLAKGVPLDLTEEDILNSVQSEIEVIDVKRLNKRNPSPTGDSDKWIPSQSVLLTFSGQTLPKEISIFFVKTSIEPYVQQPMQCYGCFSYGHTIKSCKGKKRCIMCGLDSHEGNCVTATPMCTNCKGSHKSIDSTCPIYVKYKRINIIMAYDNLSFVEAKKLIFYKESAPIRSKEHYPTLGQTKITKFFTKNFQTREGQEKIPNQIPFNSQLAQFSQYYQHNRNIPSTSQPIGKKPTLDTQERILSQSIELAQHSQGTSLKNQQAINSSQRIETSLGITEDNSLKKSKLPINHPTNQYTKSTVMNPALHSTINKLSAKIGVNTNTGSNNSTKTYQKKIRNKK